MLRLVISFLLLTACAYEGPRVEEVIPKNLENRLSRTVESPSLAGITDLVVYGDSLSDPGNLSDNTFELVLPHEIFYKGRFSNGPIWADYAAHALRWRTNNYAVGGARTHPGPFPERLAVRSLPDQIADSENDLEELNPNTTLIAIWIGPNNYLRNGGEFETPSRKTDPKLLEKGVERSLKELKENIETLQKLGFKRFILGTMPELGGINRDPYEKGYTATDATLYTATRLHNQQLFLMIQDLKKSQPSLNIGTFHAYEINKATYDDPKAFAFTRLDTPCFLGRLNGDFYGPKVFCADPMGYKFWEYLHPNTRMQCYYATQFLTDLQTEGWIAGFQKNRALEICKTL